MIQDKEFISICFIDSDYSEKHFDMNLLKMNI